MFEFVPQLCKTETDFLRLRAAACDCLRLARKTIPASFCQELFQNHSISHRVFGKIVLNSRFAGIVFHGSEVC